MAAPLVSWFFLFAACVFLKSKNQAQGSRMSRPLYSLMSTFDMTLHTAGGFTARKIELVLIT